jgi:polyvinyl alcohol dehydrogenase (cytochrome)
VSPFCRRVVLALGIALVAAVPAVGVGRAAVTPPAPSPYPGCATVGVTGGEWRTYGHDLSNTRVQDREKVIGPANVTQLQMVWSTGGNGEAFNNTPIVADGCVYLAGSNGTVRALNADTGAAVWTVQLVAAPAGFGGGIVGTPAIDGDRLFVLVNLEGGPYLQAVDRHDGSLGWKQTLDTQPLATTNASPVVHDGIVFAGFSGDAGPGENERGGYVLYDAPTGTQLAKHFSVTDEEFALGYAGAGVWSTPAIDTATGYAYVGTSNPHSPQLESARANSILKIDMDRARPTFGQIVDSYKGLPDTYVPGLADQPVCDTYPGAYYLDRFSASCLQIDLDFGASPTLYEAGGEKRIGGLQKAGVFHSVDPTTMDGRWQTVVGVPCLACNAASPASNGGDVFVAAGPPGQLFRLHGWDGVPKWVGSVTGATTYNPVTVANRIVYSVDGGGFLNGFDQATGVQLLKHNVGLDVGRSLASASTSSGIAVARNTVYVAAADAVVAYRLGELGLPTVPGAPEVPGLPGGNGGQVVAGPGAVASTYATPAVTIQQGQSLTFTNLDAVQHDVDARDGSFESPLVGLGASTPVNGVEALVPGSYAFYCSLHPNMTGTLTVQ